MRATVLAERSVYFIFSQSSLHSSDVYRCESGRCRTVPFFLLDIIHTDKWLLQALCDVTPPLNDGMLVNELGPLPRSSNRTTKKLLNLSPDRPRLFPPTSSDHVEDKNAYLSEMRAALNKPKASVRSIGKLQCGYRGKRITLIYEQ